MRCAVVTIAARSVGETSRRSRQWSLGITNAWPRVAGLMSMNATVRSSSTSHSAAARFAAIAQNTQSPGTPHTIRTFHGIRSRQTQSTRDIDQGSEFVRNLLTRSRAAASPPPAPASAYGPAGAHTKVPTFKQAVGRAALQVINALMAQMPHPRSGVNVVLPVGSSTLTPARGCGKAAVGKRCRGIASKERPQKSGHHAPPDPQDTDRTRELELCRFRLDGGGWRESGLDLRKHTVVMVSQGDRERTQSDSGSCVRKDVGVQVPLRPPPPTSGSDARRARPSGRMCGRS